MLQISMWLRKLNALKRNRYVEMGFSSQHFSGNLDEYFNSVVYHYRGGYWTYSLDSKWSDRLRGGKTACSLLGYVCSMLQSITTKSNLLG